jgi:hypothetical protein
MTIRMGYWDCTSCAHKRIEGPVPNCTNCGKPRGPEVGFYTDENAAVVEDPEMIARARAGADWHCKYCNADNRAGFIDCQNCGAGPDGTKKRAEKFMPAQPVAPPKKPQNLGLLLGIIGGALVVLFSGIWFLCIRTTALSVTVEQVTWSKSITVEELKTERKEAWRDDVPSGAREISRVTKPRTKKVQEGTIKVKVGKKDLGNGMFEDVYEEKPKLVDKQVDDTWVSYEIDRWVQGQTLKKETTDGSEPPDPSFTETRTQRIGGRSNEVLLALEGSDKKSYKYSIDLTKEKAARDKVKSFKVGQKFTAMVTAIGTVSELKP